MNKRTLTIITFLAIASILLGGMYIIFRLNWNYGEMQRIFSSSDAFRKFVLSFGVWAPLVFLVAQVVQVIISPIPGNITGLVGGALFGWVKGFALNGMGVMLGSIIAFFIARLFGQSIVIRLIGREVFSKYSHLFHTKFIVGLFLIFLFPFFPDDALCFLAGLSSLPFPVFILLIVVGRLPGMLVASLAGAGVLIFSLTQWVLIGIASLVAIYFIIRYRTALEIWFHRMAGVKEEKRDEK